MRWARNVIDTYAEQADVLVTETESTFEQASGPAVLVREPSFYRRVMRQGHLGFGESYMNGACDVKGLQEIYQRVLDSNLANNFTTTHRISLRQLAGRYLNLQRPKYARRDTNLHYDLGNDFYRMMLGNVMSYTCGYWTRPDLTLDDANVALFDLICRKLDLQPGMHILDVGCGWGAFLEYAARNYGVSGVGVNISRPQLEMCREKCVGLPIEFIEEDCRYLDMKKYASTFDRVTAIALINHIGHNNYQRFFKVLNSVLKDDGVLLVHGLANRTRSYVNDKFYDRYIFPNGVAMSMSQLLEHSEPRFVLEDFQNFCAYYPNSLLAWHQNLELRWEDLYDLGFDEKFRRMWDVYLLSAAVFIGAGKLQLFQLVLRKWGALHVYVGVR